MKQQTFLAVWKIRVYFSGYGAACLAVPRIPVKSNKTKSLETLLTRNGISRAPGAIHYTVASAEVERAVYIIAYMEIVR